MTEIREYSTLLQDIKERIRKAQIKAVLSVNAEMINLYWVIGKIIFLKQKQETWGSKIIQRLSINIQNELPDVKGFSHRNIKFMVQLYKEYELEFPIGKQAVSQLEIRKQLVSQIPWGHNILLMQKIKVFDIHFWYIEQTIQNGWSREALGSISEYDLTRVLPDNLKSSLPSIEDIESELNKEIGKGEGAKMIKKELAIFEDYQIRREYDEKSGIWHFSQTSYKKGT